MSVRETLAAALGEAVHGARQAGSLAVDEAPPIQLDVPPLPNLGDFSSDVAISLAQYGLEASFVSAHTAEEIVCVVSVPAASGPGAAVVALAVVAAALRAGDRVPSPSR